MHALALFFALLAPQQYEETITVVRYVLRVRVVDNAGRPIEDLGAEDFTVTVGGKPAHVESATWSRGSGRLQPAEDENDDEEPLRAEAGRSTEDELPRTFILYMQTDFGRNSARIAGQMKGNFIVDRVIDSIEPEARVAVLSHDSQLKLRSDFTRDRALTRKAVYRSVLIERRAPPPLNPSTEDVSLAELLDPEEMKRADRAEGGLLLIAKALREIDGPKTIILAGWGLGDLTGPWVTMPPEWQEAIGILVEQRTPVITLGTGTGGQLTAGLVATAGTTGGFHANTQDFAAQAVIRVAGALAGQYEIALRTDELLPSGALPLQIKVNRRGAVVQAPPFVINRR